MKRFPIFLIAAFALAGAAPALAQESIPGPQIGAAAPPITVTGLDGKPVSLATFKGRVLVLNFWATWCPPCRAETPDLIRAYGKLHGNDVAFLGVDSTETAPIIRSFVAAKGYPVPVGVDVAKQTSQAYDVRGIPTTFVIDRDGIVRARFVDVISLNQLVSFVGDAKAGRNGVIHSAAQSRIDALLDPARVSFPSDHDGVLRATKAVVDAVNGADKIIGTSDPAKGVVVDYLKSRAEEAALLAKAADALGRVANSNDDKKLLYRIQGDLATDREQWPQAVTAYSSALSLDPKDMDALNGIAFAYYEQKDWRNEIAYYQRAVAIAPDFDTYVSIGKAYLQLKDYGSAEAADRQAVALAMKDFKPSSKDAIIGVAYSWLYLGRAYAAGGDKAQAHNAFMQTLKYGQMLKRGTEDYAKYTEEPQEADIALNLDGTGRTAVSLAPWTGPDLPGSIASTSKYRLVVAGKPGTSVTLRASGLAKGWIASFCTDKICSPMQRLVMMPPSGVKILEFQLIRNDNSAPAHTGASVMASGSGGAAHTGTVASR